MVQKKLLSRKQKDHLKALAREAGAVAFMIGVVAESGELESFYGYGKRMDDRQNRQVVSLVGAKAGETVVLSWGDRQSTVPDSALHSR